MNIKPKGENCMDKPINNCLSQWKSYLTNISSNLMELSDQTEFQLIKLKTTDRNNGYTGITRIRADKCVESVGVLWQQFALLSEVIERAGGLERKQSILYNPEEDIRKLLEDTLIVIDKEYVDISQRNLLEDENNEKVATPMFLLKHMQESFEEICRDVREISGAEEAIQSRLSNIKLEIKKLNTTVGRLGITNLPQFEINKVTEMERDPLQGMIELDKLVYSIEKYRASIRIIEEDYKGIINSFNRIRSMLVELNELGIKSKDEIEKSRTTFGDIKMVNTVISNEVLKSLRDWLLVLENKLTEGALQAVKVGVSKLEKECSLKLDRERESYEGNSRAYKEWLDLKGQFQALLAKEEVLRARGLLVDASLNALIEATKAALYSNPVNLDACRQLVKKFKLSL